MMMRFEDVIKVVCGNFICIADGKQYGFASKDEFKDSDLYKKYVVTSIKSKDSSLVLELQAWQPPVTDMDADWVKEHKALNGSEPSFF